MQTNKNLSSHGLAKLLLKLPEGKIKIVTNPTDKRGAVEGELFILEGLPQGYIVMEGKETGKKSSGTKVLDRIVVADGELFR